MKKAILTILVISSITNANGLESFLKKSNTNIGEEKKDKFQIVHLRKKNIHNESSTNIRSNTYSGFTKGKEKIDKIFSEYKQYRTNEYEKKLANIEIHNNEDILLKKINFPKIINNKLDEKVIVKFDIINNEKIENIVFIKSTNYKELNTAIENAIDESSQELFKKNGKKEITIKYNFIL